jgi:hypothetical protein
MLLPFSPLPGLDSDSTTFSAQGRWEDVNNVRFVSGSPEVIGPFKKFLSNSLIGVIVSMIAFNRAGTVTLAYGTTSKLYVGAGSVNPTDRSPAGLGSTIEHWSFGEWGTTLLASPSGGKLYEQSGASIATEVTQAPNAITTMLVTPQRQVLALGCNEEGAGTFNGLCIRWCDLEDYTDWTTTPSNNAGEHILEGPGTIVTGVMFGEYPIVLTTDALYMGQFLGDPGQTYRFERVAAIIGPVGQKACASLNGVLFWLGSDFSVWRWSPGGAPSRVPCPMSKLLRANRPASAVQARLALMHSVSAFGEIWLHITGGEFFNYCAFSVEDGTWFKGDLQRYAALDSGVVSSVTSDGSTLLLAGGPGNYVYEHEMTSGSGAEGPSRWSMTSSDVSLDASARRVMVRSYQQDWSTDSGDGGVSHDLTLTVRSKLTETPIAKGPFPVGFIDTQYGIRCSGKIFTVSISGTASNGRPRLGKPLFDIVPLGER